MPGVTSDSRRFLFLVASTRRDGNSERLARAAAQSLPVGARATWLRFDEHPLPPFVDSRHAPGGHGYGEPTGAARQLVDATLAATDLVIVTPVYWYSLPAAAKLYFDHWSAWMRAPGLDFQAKMTGRRLWAVIVDSGSPGDDDSAPIVDMLRRTAGYMDMHWMGALHGHGNRPGDALPVELAEVPRFFSRG
jgi:NAD(P)H-dependent FMN reductase